MTNTGSLAPSISYVHAGRAAEAARLAACAVSGPFCGCDDEEFSAPRPGSVLLRAGESIVLTGPRAGSVLLPEVARVATIDYRKR